MLNGPITSERRSEALRHLRRRFVSATTPVELPSVQKCADRFKFRQEGDRRWIPDFALPEEQLQ
jgi:hypothetical protein